MRRAYVFGAATESVVSESFFQHVLFCISDSELVRYVTLHVLSEQCQSRQIKLPTHHDAIISLPIGAQTEPLAEKPGETCIHILGILAFRICFTKM